MWWKAAMTIKGPVLSVPPGPVLISTLDILCHGKFVSQLGNTLGDTNRRVQTTYSPNMCPSDFKNSCQISHRLQGPSIIGCTWVSLPISLILIWQTFKPPSKVESQATYPIWLCLWNKTSGWVNEHRLCKGPGHMWGKNGVERSMFTCFVYRRMTN